MGTIGQNSIFSEHGHFGYQIKGNRECSNMVANILSTDHPGPSDGIKSFKKSTFVEHGHVA